MRCDAVMRIGGCEREDRGHNIKREREGVGGGGEADFGFELDGLLQKRREGGGGRSGCGWIFKRKGTRDKSNMGSVRKREDKLYISVRKR